MHSFVNNMIYEGFSLASILVQIHDDLIGKTNLSDLDKALICEKIAEVSYIFISIIPQHNIII